MPGGPRRDTDHRQVVVGDRPGSPRPILPHASPPGNFLWPEFSAVIGSLDEALACFEPKLLLGLPLHFSHSKADAESR
jgi:hypothetical protein